MHKLVFDAIGTKWQIDIKSPISDDKKDSVGELIRNRIEEFDKIYSRFRSDSLIRKIASKKGIYLLPPDAEALISLYFELYKLTEGYFTPLIGQVLEDAGYDESYSLRPKTLHRPLALEDVISVDFPNVIIKHPFLLDFGAAGKGYLIDIVSEILEENGITSYCVEAGGDMRYRNDKNKILRVGLENPDNFQQVIGVADIVNTSICGSAGNRRKWGKYHHIIDPFTLTSPGTNRSPTSLPFIKATWVVAGHQPEPDFSTVKRGFAGTTMPATSRYPTMLADGLATCLFFVSPETLLNKYSFEYIIIYSDYSIKKSVGFQGEMFLRSG